MSATKDVIPGDEELRESLENLLIKIYHEVEIEGDKAVLLKLRRQQQEEEEVYADKISGKYNSYITNYKHAFMI